jgi:hypothetical protein
MTTCWKYDYLNERMAFLRQAKERLGTQDYLSCINLMYPQIEGVLRSLFVDENPDVRRPEQDEMVSNLVENKYAHSVLLPKRFEDFLMRVYFHGFNLKR